MKCQTYLVQKDKLAAIGGTVVKPSEDITKQ